MKMLSNAWDMTSGYKAYALGLLAVVWSITGYLMGYLDAGTAKEYVWAGLATLALRAGISKK
jgi:hypothetical protein